MFNIVKMDLYRTIRSKSTWILILVSISIVAMVYFAVSIARNEYSESAQGQESSGFQIGVADGTDEDAEDHEDGVVVPVNDAFEVPVNSAFAEIMQSGLSFVLAAIFCVLLISSEQKTGFIKNIAGQVSNRSMLVISKLISCLVFCILLFGLTYLSCASLSQVFLGEMIISNLAGYLPLFGIQFLLCFAFGAFMICVITILKSSAAGITAGLLAPLGISSLLTGFIDMMLHKIGVSESFSTVNYILTGNLSQMSISSGANVFVRAIVVSLVFLIIFTAAGMLVTEKRDID